MWPMMGGTAISVVDSNDFVMPTNAQPGDKIILTKPLGMRLAINAIQWLKSDDPKNRNAILK
jgi:selenide,water dikinase